MELYTYKDAIEGKCPSKEDWFFIHGLEYSLLGENLFFNSETHFSNSKIFNLVGYENPNDLFREVLGEGNFLEAHSTASSPYALTYENARKILIRLWETPIFPIHTVVQIKPDLKDGHLYGVYCNPDMLEHAGKKVEIISIDTNIGGDRGYNVYYKVKHNGINLGWSWTEDMFCETPVKSAGESKEKEYSIPKIVPIKESKLKQDCVNTQIFIKLPKHSKHLKITL